MRIIQELHDRAVTIAKDYKRCESELLSILMEVESKAVFREMGYSSMFQYCTQALKLSENQAYCFIGVARKCQEIPEIKKSIDRGEVNVGNARRIASVITEENKIEWLGKAASLTQRDLEREIVKVKPESLVKEKIRPITESKAELRCAVSVDLERKIRRIQDLLSKKSNKPCSLEDALEAMANEFILRKDPIAKAERAIERRQPADELVLRQVGPERSRYIPKPVAHEVNLRDRGQCQAKLPSGARCLESRWTHLHHRLPFERGGRHTVENLVTLCASHHRNVHV